MNRYGQQALTHWRSHLPHRLAALPNPTAHFTQMGEDIAQAIHTLERQIAGTDPPDEAYMDRLRRLNTARMEAQSRVLHAMLYSLDDDSDPETSSR